MASAGFQNGGGGEHRRAYQAHIAALRRRLEDCKPEDRAQIESEIEDAMKELSKSEDGQILW